MYLMVAGRGPFDHVHTERMVLSAHAAEEPQPPSRFATQPIPPELDLVLLRALRKDPAGRIQSAAEFREQLELIQAQEERALPVLETTAYHAGWFADPPRSATQSDYRIESEPIERASLPQELADEHAPLPLPRSGAFPKQVSPSPHTHLQRPMTELQVALLFLSALVIAAATTAALIALLRVGQ
jgi:serine/threonine protein kinase